MRLSGKLIKGLVIFFGERNQLKKLKIFTKNGDVVVQLSETKGTTWFLASHGGAQILTEGLQTYQGEYGKDFGVRGVQHHDLLDQ